MSLLALPNELVFKVASYLDQERDIFFLAYACRRTYHPLIDHLYHFNVQQNESIGVVKAAITGQVNAIKHFIAQDFDIYVDIWKVQQRRIGEEGIGPNAVSLACKANAPVEVVELLLEAGVNVNSHVCPPTYERHWRSDTYTPLHYAIIHKNLPLVRLLLHHGANLDDEMHHEGPTFPIHLASFTGPPELVQLLIDAGADVNHWDRCMRTPLWFSIGLPERQRSGGRLVELGPLPDDGKLHRTEFIILDDGMGLAWPAEEWEEIMRLLIDRGADEEQKVNRPPPPEPEDPCLVM